MIFLISLLIFNILVLGANFIFVLIGGPPWSRAEEHAPVHLGKYTYKVERFAVGVSTTVLGASWLVAWGYFMITGWGSFVVQMSSLWLHVGLQLVAGLGMVVAGVAVFRQWGKYKGLFLSSLGLLIGSTVLSLVVYGPLGHGDPFFMYLLTFWTLAVGGVLTTAVYLLDRFIESQDRKMQARARKQKAG